MDRGKRVSIFVPLTCDRACLSLTARTIIHASADRPLLAMKASDSGRRPVRTACGSDAFLVAHGVVGEPGSVLLAPWPPRPSERCTDCMTAIGKTKREPTAYHWLNLEDAA